MWNQESLKALCLDHASSSITSVICQRNYIHLYDFFADYTIAYLVIMSPEDADPLQEDLVILAAWEEQFRMKFHPSKCNKTTVPSKRDPVLTDYDFNDKN